MAPSVADMSFAEAIEAFCRRGGEIVFSHDPEKGKCQAELRLPGFRSWLGFTTKPPDHYDFEGLVKTAIWRAEETAERESPLAAESQGSSTVAGAWEKACKKYGDTP